MTAISKLELFEELFKFIKQDSVTMEQTIKEFGGSSYYIPSYKTTCRNDELLDEYKNRLGENKLIKKLSRKYNLSEAHVYLLTKPVRESSSF